MQAVSVPGIAFLNFDVASVVVNCYCFLTRRITQGVSVPGIAFLNF